MPPVSRLLLAALCLPTAAPALERLAAADPARYAPVTLVDGRPRFAIPPDSRLARNEHPRFLLTRDDLAVLRRRIADPAIAAQLAALKRRCAGRFPNNLERALVYRLTGEREWLDALRATGFARATPTFLWEWAATADLLWDEWTADERRAMSDALARAIARGGSLYWRPTLPVVSVFYEGGGGPHDAEFVARLEHDFRDTLVRWTDKLNTWAAGRGGSDMGHGYNGEHAYWEPLSAALCWTHATGEDYLARADFARYQSAFYWYHFLPELDPLCVEKIGVTRCADDPEAVAPGHCGANQFLFLTFTREGDGLGLTWMDRYRAQEPPWARDREALGRLLWWEPAQPALDPTTLPTTRLFPTSGHVTMRSDWTPDATFATFRCGRFGEIDGNWGRNNADNLSFTIRKRGPLAIDSGPVHFQNVLVLKMTAETRPQGEGLAILEYGRQTIAHNSLTVGDREFTHRDWQGKPTSAVVRRGGQSVLQAPAWWAKWGFAGPQADFRQGAIAAYRTHPLYDYARGDARYGYNPDDVEAIARQFVYLKPDVFVVHDRVVVTDPAKQPCWLLHSLREPRADGPERALTPAEIGPQWLHDGRQRAPHPLPGGHWAMGGDGWWVESGSPGRRGDGWLRVRTLLPAGNAADRRKIGGKWHDFEVAGTQYGLTEEGYRMADDPYAVRSTIGVLGWRVELRHRAPARTVEFLHVLQAGVGDRATAQDATLTSTAQAHTVTLTHAGRRFALTLTRDGQGGRLQVSSAAGEALCAEDLPPTVEDDWRHYQADPRYRAWTTDPAYRVVIKPVARPSRP